MNSLVELQTRKAFRDFRFDNGLGLNDPTIDHFMNLVRWAIKEEIVWAAKQGWDLEEWAKAKSLELVEEIEEDSPND